jgi:hypothetical protein
LDVTDIAHANRGSPDPILVVQKLTGGCVLVAGHKTPKIGELSIYKKGMPNPGYFVNCVFPLDILGKPRRIKEYSLKPGYRHDILFDFEKKRLQVKAHKHDKSKWVKDENIADEEKQDLLVNLEKLEWIAWAGETPHGVHAGVYFPDWVSNASSRRVMEWVDAQLKVAGYKGKLVMDEIPSVNCNRPSRFLPSFGFWRPDARLDVAPIVAPGNRSAAQKASRKRASDQAASLTPGLAETSARIYALECRANYLSPATTASRLKRTTKWVNEVWAANPQTAFNRFNKDIGKFVGPRSSAGRRNQVINPWTNLIMHINAYWSWEWCWQNKMDCATAKKHVFVDPAFKELLQEIELAYDEGVQLNKKPQDYPNWRAWVERDIERCYPSFRYLEPETSGATKQTIIQECLRPPGKTHITINEVARRGPYHSTNTVRKAFADLGLVCVGGGKKRHHPVPASWLVSAVTSKPPSPLLLSPTFCRERKDGGQGVVVAVSTGAANGGKKQKRERSVNPFKASWHDLAPPLVELPFQQDMCLREIEKRLSKSPATNPEWNHLLSRRKNDQDKELSPLLNLVRAYLGTDGHVYHQVGALQSRLRHVLGAKEPEYLAWLRASGRVVDVSRLVAEKGQSWIAWRGYLEGEVRFTFRVVEHCVTGGALEVFAGEPGTGKTEDLAKRIASHLPSRNCCIGSATKESAAQLDARISRHRGSQRSETIHKAFRIGVPVGRAPIGNFDAELYIGDEMGQVDCDVAGVMAVRWRRGSEVLLSVGVGQNQPVGPGNVGEDLVAWLRIHDVASATLTNLTENHRMDKKEATGIVEFFQAVGRGEPPKKLGPGMETRHPAQEYAVLGKVAMVEVELDAYCFAPERNICDEVNHHILELEREAKGNHNSNPWEIPVGQRMMVVNVEQTAASAGLQKGDEVTVAVASSDGCNPNGLIYVNVGGYSVGVLKKEIQFARCRTGHKNARNRMWGGRCLLD